MANREYEHIIKHLEHLVKIWNQTAYNAERDGEPSALEQKNEAIHFAVCGLLFICSRKLCPWHRQ
jgi:hypothetical protein